LVYLIKYCFVDGQTFSVNYDTQRMHTIKTLEAVLTRCDTVRGGNLIFNLDDMRHYSSNTNRGNCWEMC
jgi:hypothetical protein